MTEIDEVRCQRDECRAKLAPLARENERLRMLLGYAEEAIQAEYNLRVGSCSDIPQGVATHK